MLTCSSLRSDYRRVACEGILNKYEIKILAFSDTTGIICPACFAVEGVCVCVEWVCVFGLLVILCPTFEADDMVPSVSAGVCMAGRASTVTSVSSTLAAYMAPA